MTALSAGLKKKISEIFKLSLPITTSFVAMGIMGIIDTIIVGHYNTEQLAYIGLANAVFSVLFTIPIGLLQGVLIKSSQKFGAHKFASCGKIYNEGKRYLVFLSIFFTAIGINGQAVLSLLGQNQDMVVNGGAVLTIFSISIPFVLFFVNSSFFLQSIRRPHIAMYGVVAANIINIMINPLLVYGLLGFPELGARGSAISTLIVRIFLVIYIVIYIRKMEKNPKLNKRFGLSRKYNTWWTDSKTTRQIGYGVAITTIATNGSYSAVSNFAGWLGEEMMAAFVIFSNVSMITFMVCFSLSQATSIVCANAFGKKNAHSFLLSAKAGGIILSLALLVMCSILWIFRQEVFAVFTQDEFVIMTLSGLIVFLILEIVCDSLPLGIMGPLNGRGDVKIPTIFQAIAFLGVRISACYILAFQMGFGIIGLVVGLSIGGLTSMLLNGARFIYLIRRDVYKGVY